jgi:RNA polymerase sigma-70 factor (ECF subfamily)
MPRDGVESACSPAGDKSLIRRYRAGGDEAATALYLRYARRLRGMVARYCGRAFAGRFDADDVTQSVFRTFFDGVRREAYDAPDGGEIWALLVALALNKVRNLVDHHTAAKRDVRTTLPPDADPAAVVEQDESAAAFLRLVVEEQMDALPESSREIVRLRIEGCEVGEIVARTGRSARTVERVLQRFRSLLCEP